MNGLESRLRKLEEHRDGGLRIEVADPLAGESEQDAIERRTMEYKAEHGPNALIMIITAADANL